MVNIYLSFQAAIAAGFVVKAAAGRSGVAGGAAGVAGDEGAEAGQSRRFKAQGTYALY